MPGRVDSRRDVTAVAGASGAATTARVLVLGPLMVKVDDRPLHVAGSHRRRLLALLASRAGRVVAVDAIVDALWGEDPPPTATKTIQSHVARLRASFTPVDGALIETVAGGYRLAVDPAAVDAIVFERLSAEGRRLLAAGEFSRAVGVLGEALALWRGPAYSEFATAEFAAAEAIRLDELRWAAIEELAEARLEAGAVASLIADLEGLVAEQPGRERAWGLLMRALYAAGRQHDALVAFQRARRALADRFGLGPGPELCGLERRVLEQDPDLTVRRRPMLPAGLRRDPNPLVGRDRELAWLTEGWRVARGGSGQLRMLLGPVDSGRTRLAAELAATVIGDGGQVVHARAPDGFARPLGVAPEVSAPGAIVDVVIERSRVGPLLLVVEDAEWSSEPTTTAIAMLTDLIEQVPVMVLVVADPTGAGPAIQALRRLDRSGGHSLNVEPLSDEAVARIVTADGVEGDGVAAIVAVAGGLAGVARREATAWAERTASDRLTAAAAAAIGATAIADDAQASVFDEVLALVAARARRDELVSATWAGRQPYRALAAYGPQDADLFVGRERLVAELAARMLDRRLVVVVGASGSGKSSLVRAGLVPLVRSGRLPGTGPWRASVIIPGDDPLGALDAVEGLDEPGPQLLVVDQLEEAFTSGAADTFGARLVDLVLDAALDVHAVVVVRADQYPALAATPPLAELVDDAQVIVGAPSDDEWRRIIEIPARRTGCIVEPALVAAIGQDVTGRDAALPLVSTALAEVWERRDGDTLTADGYEQLGGLAAAVDRMGVRAVERAGGGDAVREVMLRLVDVTEDGQWVRRRIDVDEIPDRLEPALDALVSERLVQLDDQQLGVVHEIVFRAWPQLAAWLEAARNDLVLDRELRAAARAWDGQGRSDDDVYRGARLAAAIEYTTKRQDLAPPVAEFVTAGQRLAERQHVQVRQQLARETRARRRLSRALIAAAILLAGALAAGALALVNQRRADEQRERAADAATVAQERQRDAETAQAAEATARDQADRQRAVAQARELVAAADASLGDDPELSMHLALTAVEMARVDAPGALPEAESALHRAVTTSRAVLTVPNLGGRVDWSPDGRMFVTEGPERSGLIDLRDAESGASLRSWRGHDVDISFVTFSPDGSRLATAGDDGALRLWDPASGELVWEYVDTEHTNVWEPTFSADGTAVVASWRSGGPVGGPLRAFDAATGAVLLELAPAEGVATSPSPDGRRVVFSDISGLGGLADAGTGDVLAVLSEGGWMKVQWSPDGRYLAAAIVDGAVQLRSSDGDLLDTASGHVGQVNWVDWSPDSTRLVTGGNDGTVRLWTVADDALHQQLVLSGAAMRGGVASVAFSPDGERVMAGDYDVSAVTVWDVSDTGGAEWGVVRAAPGSGRALSFASDGSRVVVSSTGGGADVVDLASGRRATQLERSTGDVLTHIELSPDGRRLAVSTGEDGFDLIDVASRARIGGLPAGAVADLAWSHDGTVLAASLRWPDVPNAVIAFDRDGTDLARYELPPDTFAPQIAVSPDGRLIAMGHQDALREEASSTDLTVWDWRADVVVATIRRDESASAVAFDPTGTRLVAASLLGPAIEVWDVATGERVTTLTGAALAIDVAFSPDGNTIATGNYDGVVRLWDADSGVRRLELRGHDSAVERVVFSTDGSRLASISSDGLVRVWAIDLDDLVALAESRITRPMTDDECRQYLHLDRCRTG